MHDLSLEEIKAEHTRLNFVIGKMPISRIRELATKNAVAVWGQL